MRRSALTLLVLLAALAAPAAHAQAPPRLNLNTASAQELEALPGIGPVAAERIVRIRERNGPYRCVEELRAVPRLTEAQIDLLRRHLAVESPDPRCAQQESARRAGRPIESR